MYTCARSDVGSERGQEAEHGWEKSTRRCRRWLAGVRCARLSPVGTREAAKPPDLIFSHLSKRSAENYLQIHELGNSVPFKYHGGGLVKEFGYKYLSRLGSAPLPPACPTLTTSFHPASVRMPSSAWWYSWGCRAAQCQSLVLRSGSLHLSLPTTSSTRRPRGYRPNLWLRMESRHC